MTITDNSGLSFSVFLGIFVMIDLNLKNSEDLFGKVIYKFICESSFLNKDSLK